MTVMDPSLTTALDQVIAALVEDTLVRAVGSGTRRGEESPRFSRVDIRPVELKGVRHLQMVWTTPTGPLTTNIALTDRAGINQVVDEPFGNWRVETTEATIQMRVTKRGKGLIHRSAPLHDQVGSVTHDRPKNHVIGPDDPLFAVVGAGSDKRRQVDAFLQLARPILDDAFPIGAPLTTVDLGCGNSSLTLAAHRYLSEYRPGSRTIGIEQRPDLVRQSTDRARQVGLDRITFVATTIAEVDTAALGLDRIDVALALHACDTATDDALAWAVAHHAHVILAAPCCHHDINRQMAKSSSNLITAEPILRERFADVVTDSLRAHLLRRVGYRTDVVEFVDSRHTPRNAMIRAVRDPSVTLDAQSCADYDDLITRWGLQPALAERLNQMRD